MDIEFRLDYFGINTTTDEALAPEIKTFYDRALITLARPELIYAQLGQKRVVPPRSGKYIEFRVFDDLPVGTDALTEGVTPESSRMSVTSVEAKLNQYGGYIEQTDLLELTAIDNTVVEATKQLASQAARTLDVVVRDELMGGENVLFASGPEGAAPADVSGLDSSKTLTVRDVLSAAARLRAVNAPTFDGSYVAVVHPYVAADLMANPVAGWVEAVKYADPKRLLNGEIGKIGGVRFIESTQAKITEAGEILPGVVSLTLASTVTESDDTCVIAEDIDPDNLVGVTVCAGGVEADVTDAQTGDDGVELTLSAALPALSAGAKLVAPGSSGDGSPVFSTIVLGKGAFGVTALGAGTVEHIIKQLGSGADPLNQRSSVGWKATMAVKRLVEDYMIRIESCSALGGAARGN